MFDYYSRIVSEVKYKTKYGKGLKILTPKQMIQKLPVALAQSEMKSDKSYILYIKQEKLLKKYIPIQWIQ